MGAQVMRQSLFHPSTMFSGGSNGLTFDDVEQLADIGVLVKSEYELSGAK